MKDDYAINVEMVCPLCGGKTFEYDELDSPVKCIGCNKIFTREELFDSNQENMSINMDELKKEVLDDVASDFKNMLKKTFKNNKNFKIK